MKPNDKRWVVTAVNPLTEQREVVSGELSLKDATDIALWCERKSDMFGYHDFCIANIENKDEHQLYMINQ